MSRPLQLALGIAAVVIGLGLSALIALIWLPCVGAQMPLDPLVASECAAVSSGSNTGWIGLLLWPVALAVAGFAAVRILSRGSGVISYAIVILLAVVTFLANPLPEYWLLNLSAQSWDEPPGTGALTATTFVLAGVVLLATSAREVRSSVE
ncbi:hypothetical protein [Agrococcus sp. ARC_14]|uniref:hypothetical protein n=1 Tax=Agrococcus sp. ARC_14 TaxID=2919927 RepID=UPI001F069773|nr:hypothetical protein [Agrococcus sp. ARC_14]MCH1884320.1 hypothetical protein [Agrococcus sp. ARC_14]